jgi:hypothetical protein
MTLRRRRKGQGGLSVGAAGMVMVVAAVVVAAGILAVSYPAPSLGGTSSTTSTTFGTTTTHTGTATYQPLDPVKVVNVTYALYPQANGSTRVVFSVLWVNTGTSPIYVAGGCGSGLTVNATGASEVLKQVRNVVLCMCPAYFAPVEPGGNHTSSAPGCWSGYAIEVVGRGTVSVPMTLSWSGGSGAANETAITTTFSF